MTLAPPFQTFDELQKRRVALVDQTLQRIRLRPRSPGPVIHLLPTTGMQSGTDDSCSTA